MDISCSLTIQLYKKVPVKNSIYPNEALDFSINPNNLCSSNNLQVEAGDVNYKLAFHLYRNKSETAVIHQIEGYKPHFHINENRIIADVITADWNLREK